MATPRPPILTKVNFESLLLFSDKILTVLLTEAISG